MRNRPQASFSALSLRFHFLCVFRTVARPWMLAVGMFSLHSLGMWLQRNYAVLMFSLALFVFGFSFTVYLQSPSIQRFVCAKN